VNNNISYFPLIQNTCSSECFLIDSTNTITGLLFGGQVNGNIDFAFSEIMLNAGHCYSIRFNDSPKNPTITRMFRELPKK